MLAVTVFAGSSTYGQFVTCEELARHMEADTTKSIWNYQGVSPETYYCLGKHFAARDLEKNLFFIHTYGSPEWAEPCRLCRYESHGFSFFYHFDLIREEVTSFIEGYNEISKRYLKEKIGDSAFAHIDDIPAGAFMPRAILGKPWDKHYYSIEKLNDSTINVKLYVDSIFKDYPQLLDKIVYEVSDPFNKKRDSEEIQPLGYQQIKQEGFRLSKNSRGKYYVSINFDFKGIAGKDNVCWCDGMNRYPFRYVVPVKEE